MIAIKLASVVLGSALAVTGSAAIPAAQVGRIQCLVVPATSYMKAHVQIDNDGTMPQGTRGTVCKIKEQFPTAYGKYRIVAPNGMYEVFRIDPVRYGKK